MDSISNNISNIDPVRTVMSQNNINKAYNLPLNNIISFQKQISDQDKSAIVSEQENKNSDPAAFYYQYQSDVPISLLSTTSQPYNETSKPFSTNISSSSTDENVNDNSNFTVEEINDKNQRPDLGYYIIDKNIGTAVIGKPSHKLYNIMKERLNKIYNLNLNSEPGTIVNVTCY
jgi:hypothetical protein